MAPFSSCQVIADTSLSRSRIRSACQASMATIRWRAKLSTSRPEPRSSKPSSLERRRQRTQAGIASRPSTPMRMRGAEHQPIRRLGFRCIGRPGQPAAADQAAIDMDGVGPAEGDRPLRRGVHQQRVAQRHHAGVEGAARARQRLLRLEHDGEFRQIEAPDVHQRARALLGRNGLGVREGVAHLPQRHQAEGRRQIQRGRCEWCGCGFASRGRTDPRRIGASCLGRL